MNTVIASPIAASESHLSNTPKLVIGGGPLSISKIAAVAAGAPVELSKDARVREAIAASRDFIRGALAENRPIYGVTTSFGGMADRVVPPEVASDLQTTLVWSHKAGAGERIPAADVRAAMLLRANSLAMGISGIRAELIERFEIFLNEGVTPHVREFGSIGASGDQVPLACIAGALAGLSPRFRVDWKGQAMESPAILAQLGLKPVVFEAKEGLALINGTSVTTGIAANCVQRARRAFALAIGAHALFLQALSASNQAFHPFIHIHKAHPGQRWTASQMLRLLDGSQLSRDELCGQKEHRSGQLIQDRYSVRCLPQFLGPIADALTTIAGQVEVEASSVTDNPLIDAAHGAAYHCGNFLSQYIGTGMDQLRYHMGMLAKHVDVQIALLVSPEFNNGLPPSLVGNGARPVNTGLKALQLTANSMMPVLGFYGNSLADRFPTHAEQFNQNLNSQGFGSANLTRRALGILEEYLAVALVFAVQAVDLRTHAVSGHYDSRATLSPATRPLYEAVHAAAGRPASAERPLVWDDRDQFLEEVAAGVATGLSRPGPIGASVEEIFSSLAQHRV